MTHSRSTRCLGIVAASLVCMGSAFAQVVTVGQPSSGAQYDNIADGIAAVPAGGVVLVAPGAYVADWGLTIDKPMTLLGVGSSRTVFKVVSPLPALLTGLPVPIKITNIAAGEEVVVAGLRLCAETTFEGAFAAALTISGCAGSVAITDVQGITVTANATLGVAVVRNSSLVTMDGCSFVNEIGLSGGVVGAGPLPTPGIFVTNSLVHVTDCVVQGGLSRGPIFAHVANDGAPGVSATGAIVRVARSVITGGGGTNPGPFLPVTIATKGGAAIDATSSQILVRGGVGNLLTGGMGGTTDTSQVLYGAGGAAVQLDATSLASTTPDVAMMAGLDGDNQLLTPEINGPGLHAALAFPLPVLSTVDKLVAPGAAAQFEVAGEPGSVCLSLLATRQASPLAIPGILGVFTLQFPEVVSLPVVTLDATGVGSFSVMLPANPTLAGIAAYSQAVSFGPGGWVSVSSPTCFVVR